MTAQADLSQDHQPPVNLTGRRFGRWKVQSYAGRKRTDHSVIHYWNCRCQCGTLAAIPTHNLLYDHSTKCKACAYEAQRIHGITKTPLYMLWLNKVRNNCVKSWKKFETFNRTVGKQRNGWRFLIRRDSSKPHSPSNSFWSDYYQKGWDSRQRIVQYLVESGEDRAIAEERVKRMTNARRGQLLWMIDGKCRNCGGQLDTGGLSCQACRQRQRDRKRDKQSA